VITQKKKLEPADVREENMRKYAFLKRGSLRCRFSSSLLLGIHILYSVKMLTSSSP